MRPPRACTRSTAKARKRSEEAPRHCGSLGGKCTPMSPSAQRAEDRIDQRMQHDVGVGMAGDAAVMGDAHAAEPDVIAGGELMHVEAEAGAHVAERGELRGLRAREILRRW